MTTAMTALGPQEKDNYRRSRDDREIVQLRDSTEKNLIGPQTPEREYNRPGIVRRS